MLGKNFYISISNGLLKNGHPKRMGAAVWEFMWLIDRITKIDETGTGWVLGGKPINLSDIAKDLGFHENTISGSLIKLENLGYIGKIIAPYGLIIKVNKAKKRFTKNSEAPTENSEAPTENSEANIRQGNRQYTDDSIVAKPPSAKAFFENKEKQEELIKVLSEKKNIPIAEVRNEMYKFVNYWCEPNKSGTKLRWQGQNYFDVRMRLATWFKNYSEWQSRNGRNKQNIIGIAI